MRLKLFLIAVGAVSAAAVLAGADVLSVDPAARLTALLDQRKLDAFAAADPETPGRFAATLYFPGVQMLTVAGMYSAPQLLQDLIAAGNYRQVYVDLSTAAAREGRFFVEDFGMPGIRLMREDDQRFDRVWRNTTLGVTYDGNWKTQKLPEGDYRKRFAADDADYARVLSLLIEALNSPAPASPK
jgi:hypothetical protein